MQNASDSIRINRFFTDQGLGSRREADRAISSGRVRINGRIAKLGDQVSRGDKVSLDGKFISVARKRPVVIAFHKPIGIECTTDLAVKDNIINAVKYDQRIFPIGRLDKDSEGLILLTNLGEVVNKILRSENRHEKEYVVNTDLPVTDQAINAMRQGVKLEDGLTKPCKVSRLGAHCFSITLTEGRNRQIRRMAQHCGLIVTRLKRLRIMNIELGELPKGQWRSLGPKDLENLLQDLGDSQSEPGKKNKPIGNFPTKRPTKPQLART